MKPGYLVVANFAGNQVFRLGAKLTVLDPNWGNAHENVMVRGVSRGGRIVEMWVRGKRLWNFRPSWWPKCDWVFYDTKREAQRQADIMNGWRPFKPAWESAEVFSSVRTADMREK